mmetsp:Transcript_8128/g.9318  ORF Transcript_8128/g.9318 Transcript_8128/m.9318 type:complete len:380 (+) Transcript_8128:243-1382(+)
MHIICFWKRTLNPRRPERYNKPAGQIFWKPASRTDKGVHAVGCAISLSLRLNDDDFENSDDMQFLSASTIQKINSYLPKDVQVFSGQRIHPTFDAQLHCSIRIYEYLIPKGMLPEGFDFDQFQSCLHKFQGVHNFHNFGKYAIGKLKPRKVSELWNRISVEEALATQGAAVADLGRLTNSDQYRRIVYSCDVEADSEFLQIKIIGKSFLYNQIRRMVGAALLVGSYDMPLSIITAALESPFDLPVKPVAPACGLLLLESIPYRHRKYRFEKDIVISPSVRKEMNSFRQKLQSRIRDSFSKEDSKLDTWFRRYRLQCREYGKWKIFSTHCEDWNRRVEKRLSQESTKTASDSEGVQKSRKSKLPKGWLTHFCIATGKIRT